DDNSQTKTDAKDARVIARLVKDGHYSSPRILHDQEAELRVGANLRESLTQEQGATKNKIIRWLDRYFPEFRRVFPSFGKMAFAVMEQTPFPEDVNQYETDELLALYRNSEGMKAPQRPKTEQLKEVARLSIGVTEGQQMARIEIATLVRRYHQLEEEIETLTAKLTELVKTTVSFEYLQTVPGLGDATIIDLLAETGDL
ncbi:IS110 family transposase, partial [Shouchella shacheensis]|uniref:IS110 family transposase n=1 Tax=Shouchella shacheensis TaxID=1649580 RepID=UPI000AA87D4F